MYLKQFNFPHYQNNCWHADWCQEWNIKTLLLKISKIHLNRWPCFPMQMFLSISGHSSELSRANHSPRSTASKLKCVSDNISSWFENHQPQKTKIPTVIYPPVIQNLNQMAATFTVTTSFPRIVFSTPVIFKATSKLFGSQGCSDDKNWLDFSSIFFKTCRFRSSILAFAVSFPSRRSDARVRFDSGAIFLDQSRFFATHSNQWNCFILNRS